jgi:AraC-like DNA-binding protein
MSDPIKERLNAGACVSPYYSGLGVEFNPLGVTDETLNPVLHETGYLPNNSKWNFPSVLSPFWRIYYNLDGGHRIFIDEEAHELVPGHLFIIPGQRFIHCNGENPVRHFWMAFSVPSRWVDLLQPLPIELEPTPEERALIAGVSGHIEQRADRPDKEIVYHESMALLHLLFARLEILWKPPFPESLSRLLSFIDHHAHEAIPNQMLARQAGMSIPTLCRAFQSCLHTTPANYVNQVRVSKAVHLLEQTELGMDEIADQVGFPNRAYFSRVFKKVTTLSPAEFRKRKAIHRQSTSREDI